MKIILFANTDWYLYNFRLTLAQALSRSGHQVILISPPGDYSSRIMDAGYDWRPLVLSRKGMNPFREIRSIMGLVSIYKQEKPNLVHHFTIKCMLYGTIAAKWAKVPTIINAVTGLGFLFSRQRVLANGMRSIVLMVYRWVLKGTTVIFQNVSDQQYLVNRKIISGENSVLIPGSGVDVSQFIPKPDQIESGFVVLPGRMLWDKGVEEFVEAARILKEKRASLRLALVGSLDPGNPSSLSEQQLRGWIREKTIEWWGWQEDMVSVYQRAEIVCLPSYHEGLSKSLIEAAACGCPLIASDIPGCREVVREGVNGRLVPKGDALALAAAITKMLDDPESLQRMRQMSRKIAVCDFALDKVIANTIKVYDGRIVQE